MDTIKVNRETFIKTLSAIKEDNISICGIAIDRRKLIEALKLQTQPGADTVSINYGNVSWEYAGSLHKDGTWEDKPYTFGPSPCVQFSCDHTVMRFLNKPRIITGHDLQPIPLDFDAPKAISTNGTPIPSHELLEALDYTLRFVDANDYREVLNGLLFESAKGVLNIVGVDGYRLCQSRIKVTSLPRFSFILRTSEISRLIHYLKQLKPTGKGKARCYPDVMFSHNKKSASFDTLQVSKFKGDYPKYQHLIPKEGTKVKVIASQLLQAVKSVSPAAKDDPNGIIRLLFGSGLIQVWAHSEEIGDMTADCPAKVDSECKIAVNYKYLISSLTPLKDSKVTLRITEPSSPMRIDTDNSTQVLMPVFVQW